ncbi:SxtJ family membrane protein [Teredinibacter purpureus]|uniref:SxtJ family membrane protein n=1 Tax=Teredinibacter purpureus TaxID=2731756 RepID=UPI0005F765CC|nr:SxtJ family membrane protein [Teredinibacter purpureus]
MSNNFIVKVDNPGAVELRKFGVISAAFFVAIFALLLPWVFEHGMPQWPWIVAAVLIVWALVWPASLFIVYVPWMKIGGVLGYINTRILLGAVFYVLITPVGFVVRLFGSSNIKSHETDESSFRVESHKPDHTHMENPY